MKYPLSSCLVALWPILVGDPFVRYPTRVWPLNYTPTISPPLIKAGGYPLRYEPDAAASKSYTVIPKDLIEGSAPAFEAWLLKSMDHCKSLPLPKKRTKKKKK